LKKIWYLVIGVVIVGLFASFFGQKFIGSTSIKKDNTQKVVGISLKDRLIVLNVKNNTSEILELGETNKVLFTDSKAKSKIKTFADFTNKNDILITNNSNQLIDVKFDGANKMDSIVSGDFSSQEFVLSPSGKKLAFITFSNAERDYGYSLNIADANGKNSKSVLKQSQLFGKLSWLNDNKLFFIDSGESSSSIKLIDLTNNSISSIYAAWQNTNLYDLSVIKNRIYFSQDSITDNSTELLSLDLTGKDLIKIVKEKGYIRNIVGSPDETKLAYLVKSKVDGDNGSVLTIDLNGQNKQDIAVASKILTWLP